MSEIFASTLSALRQEKKLSQRVVSKELGVSQAVLSHYENGVREPGLDFVVRAAEYYHVSTDYLLGRTMMREDFSVAPQEFTRLQSENEQEQKGTREFYIAQNKQLIASGAFPNAETLGLKFKKTSQRYYFCLMQPQHAVIMTHCVERMLKTPWKNHFVLLEG